MADISIKVCEHNCNPEAGTARSRLEILRAYVAGDRRYAVTGVQCLGGCMFGHSVKVETGDKYAFFVDRTYCLDSFTKHPEDPLEIIDNLKAYLKKKPR
jgi:hypothetical protein